jgi:NAD(P)-dependent dehydrogenase (short-subunit alcohol dehydrogenase family)
MSTFGFSSTTDDVLSGVDLTGRLAVVTGASTGLGEETTRALADHGAVVVMAVRDVDRGETAAGRVRAAVDHPVELEVRELDLASLDSVRAFAEGFLAEHDRLDLLINNAGLMACPYGTTTDGFELQFGTNHLGHFLLGTLLTPALVAGAPSRLVSLTSRGHAVSDVDLDDYGFERTPYDAWVAYGRSKTANALFAVAFDRRHADEGVRAYSVHPGGIHTELARHLTDETLGALRRRLESGGRQFQWKTIPQGAATSVWAATAAELDSSGGQYLEDCGVAEITDEAVLETGVRAYAQDPQRAEALWELSERLVAR